MGGDKLLFFIVWTKLIALTLGNGSGDGRK